MFIGIDSWVMGFWGAARNVVGLMVCFGALMVVID